MKPKLAIFAGSKLPNDAEAVTACRVFGSKIGASGYDIIYGGGTEGLMGVVAEAAQQAGSHVTAAVLAQYAHETQFPDVTIVNVGTEHERFLQFCSCENLSAFIAFPGSAGTLREVFQGLERAIYEDGCPIILANVGPYLDGIQDFFDISLAQGITRAEKKDALRTWNIDQDLGDVLDASRSLAAILGSAKKRLIDHTL